MNLSIKWLNFLFPIPSIIFLILMGILLKSSTTADGNPITLGYWLFLMLILFIFLVLPFDIIRWLLWGKRKYLKRVSEQLNIRTEATLLIEKTHKLANTINTTTDRNTFEIALSELKETLKRLIQYEKFGFFNESTPSQDLADLLNKEALVRIELENRIKNNVVMNTHSSTNSDCDYDSMEGLDFEYFCADLLKKNGFVDIEVTQGSGDHGIDVLATKDDITYAIQCKCYASNIGNAAVQQAHTGKSLYHRDVAVVMTNRYFTSQAKDEAKQLNVKLWDRDKLNEFIQNSST